MNLLDLTPDQLNRAASIKEQIDALHKELRNLLSGSPMNGATPEKTHRMSASVKKKIAATQKARWAKLRGSKAAMVSTSPAAKKKPFSSAARAKLSAKLKAYWAAKRKSGKN